MAERRMFAKTIIRSDAFLDMPASTQCLYFQLNAEADDEGFVNSPKSVMRVVKCSDDDLAILIVKKFIIPFESGIIVIKHWRIHNYIRGDRIHPTKYQEEKSLLVADTNNAYRLSTKCQSDVSQLSDSCHTEVRLGKVRLGKVSIGEENKDIGGKTSRFIPPSVEQVADYCITRNNGVDPQTFVDFYESKGWVVGKAKMKDWKAAVRNWENKRKPQTYAYDGSGEEFSL